MRIGQLVSGQKNRKENWKCAYHKLLTHHRPKSDTAKAKIALYKAYEPQETLTRKKS